MLLLHTPGVRPQHTCAHACTRVPQGAHVFLPGGNLRLLEALAQGVPIAYNARARLVQYCSTGVSARLLSLPATPHRCSHAWHMHVAAPSRSRRRAWPKTLCSCCRVRRASLQVQVHTDSAVYAADAVLVTVPLGVLKRPDGLAFQPPLPPRKQLAIRRLGFGVLNKVMLLFPHCFWGGKVRRSASLCAAGLSLCDSAA